MLYFRRCMLGSLLLAAPAFGQVHYDIGKNGDNKINISWESRATVETMIGRTVVAHGLVKWDAADPSGSSLSVRVPVKDIRTGIDLRDQHMRSSEWLDAEKYPDIAFETSKIKPVADKEDTYALTGTFDCHGEEKQRTIEAVVKLIPAKKELEQYGYIGDMVHIQAKFEVALADHNIAVPSSLSGVKVAPTVTCNVDIFGLTNNKPHR